MNDKDFFEKINLIRRIFFCGDKQIGVSGSDVLRAITSECRQAPVKGNSYLNYVICNSYEEYKQKKTGLYPENYICFDVRNKPWLYKKDAQVLDQIVFIKNYYYKKQNERKG